MQKNHTELLQEIFSNFTGMSRLMHTRFHRTFEHAKIAPSQLQLLYLIECSQPISLKDLAAKMYMTPGAITQLIDGFVNEGYVSREQSAQDRRITCVSLTKTGSKKIAGLNKKKLDMFADVVSTLNDKELHLYLRVQQKMLAYLREDSQNVKK